MKSFANASTADLTGLSVDEEGLPIWAALNRIARDEQHHVTEQMINQVIAGVKWRNAMDIGDEIATLMSDLTKALKQSGIPDYPILQTKTLVYKVVEKIPDGRSQFREAVKSAFHARR